MNRNTYDKCKKLFLDKKNLAKKLSNIKNNCPHRIIAYDNDYGYNACKLKIVGGRDVYGECEVSLNCEFLKEWL